MAHINKFQIHWQIVRVKARKIKDVERKIDFVKQFLISYDSLENKERVKNWATMTSMGYRDKSIKDLFKAFLQWISSYSYNSKDLHNDFAEHPNEDLLLVYKDLSKRKYGFQYSKTPKSHIDFMDGLSDYLSSSGVI